MTALRLSIAIRGTVQGVGFRPFVYREAHACGLSGWVRNEPEGVSIEVQGTREAVEHFLSVLQHEAPPAAAIAEVVARPVPPRHDSAFRILESEQRGRVSSSLPADIAVCAACSKEVQTPGNRRRGYPFTNCADCGPRYSIVTELPYDRVHTSMASFPLCDACRREFEDVTDRRFHAQPIACPACGPKLELLAPGGDVCARAEAALDRAVLETQRGRIVALKGLGGFQLVVDASDEEAVERLRRCKRRDERPFAVLFASLEHARSACQIDAASRDLLTSDAAPIVLCPCKPDADIARAVAPNNPFIGVMLPPTPLHALFSERVGRAVVCTSGNLSGEPMCTEAEEAVRHLAGVADLFLTHDRGIVRALDDSVLRPGVGLLRRARGYAPRAVARFHDAGRTVLGVGGHLKSTVSLAVRGQVVPTEHLGDLDTAGARDRYERATLDLLGFFDAVPDVVACDLHPDYFSTTLAESLARRFGARLVGVQHHHAHVAAVVLEHQLKGPVLGLSWDGAGYGADGQIWGGEALVCEGAEFQRVGHLRPFHLPAAEAAFRQPWRAALAIVIEAAPERLPDVALCSADDAARLRALARGAPCCTSIGRLFDAVAALLGIRRLSSFEGQAAMELEFAALRAPADCGAYPFGVVRSGDASEATPWVADFAPLLQSLLDDLARGISREIIAARFHSALTDAGIAFAEHAGIENVVLAGGCFQNAWLTRALCDRLTQRGFRVHRSERLPANDGALSAGQIYVALHAAEGPHDVSRHPR